MTCARCSVLYQCVITTHITTSNNKFKSTKPTRDIFMERKASKSATRNQCMLQAESSSAPKSGSPSSEAMQELEKRTPTKR